MRLFPAVATLAVLASSVHAQESSLRLIDSTPGRLVYELTVDWGDSEIGGHLEETAAITLPSLVSPGVRVSLAEYDESPHEPVAGLGDAPASVVGLGLARKRPTATLVARLATYDSTSSVLRKYRRMQIEVTFDMQVRTIPTSDNPHLAVSRSVLAEGQFFKLAIQNEGVYRIDRAFLESLPGLATNVESIDPANVRVFGNGGAPVPEHNSTPRIADLAENPVFVQGGGDGSFDSADAVWFYARGPYGWRSEVLANLRGEPLRDEFGNLIRQWEHYVHPFDTTAYYFVQIGDAASTTYERHEFSDGLPSTRLDQVTGRYVVDYDEFLWGREGGHSGHTWVSALIPGSGPGRGLLNDLDLPRQAAGEVTYEVRVAIQSNPAATLFFNSGTSTLESVNLGASSTHSTSPIARSRVSRFSQTVAGGTPLNLTADLEDQAGAPQAALDWLRVFYPKDLTAGDDPLRWHTPLAQTGAFTFVMRNYSAAPFVLDITDPADYRWLEARAQGSDYLVQVAVADEDQPRELIAFSPNQVQSLDIGQVCPGEHGCRVSPQNLHGIQSYPDLVIVTPALLQAQAEELADLRRSDGLVVEVVNVAEIYNEFSGGLQDIRGIRDYLKFIYDRAPGDDELLRYVLFFGDGHFDYRGLDPAVTFPNLIPPFETEDSWNPETSYTTDDYFGLLDDNEGRWPYARGTWLGSYDYLNERVDIGIGRMPVHTTEEAQLVVDKIKHYESADTFGPWRTKYLFLADDGPTGTSGQQNDRDLHTQNTDVVAVAVAQVAPEVNQKKVYALSYPRVFLNEWRIPRARQDLLTLINSGVLVVNFSGHGGEHGLAQENLFTSDDSRSLQNYDVLPVFITATCSFGRWDLGNEQTGAEELLLNPDGGAIALLTTVRTVYTSGDASTLNVGLNVALNRELFTRDADGLAPRLGDALRRTKNVRVGYEGNNRKFNLLGDPSMRIGLPPERVAVTHINDTAVQADQGRMRALERIELRGEVRTAQGQVDTGFEGTVALTVFDAQRRVPIPAEMLRYMPTPYYEVREDLVWRGKVTATGGRFTARFVVPKDIAHANLAGRVSAHAVGADTQLLGYTENFIVGGTADDVADDRNGPEIDLYLGDETFTSGGLTTASPSVLAHLYDESGINTVGAGVGHEMLLVLDENEKDAVNIGDLYEAAEDSYQQGTVNYTFEESLDPGPHTLSLRAWDVLNNSGQTTLEFVVTDTEELVVRNVLNYPNPTTGPTRFVFEHNQPAGTPVSVRVRIYTLSGRAVRTIEEETVLSAGPTQVLWDGRDDDYAPLRSGVYLYQVRVEVPGTESIQVAEVIERLAVIR